MNSRRTFIGRMAAAVCGLATAPFAARAVAPREKPIGITIDFILLNRGKPIDVTGASTPPCLIKGDAGSTYILAGLHHIHRRLDCRLNGEWVSMRCGEADAIAGWARMFDVDEKGNLSQFVRESDGTYKNLWTYDTSRPENTIGKYIGCVERIHFGHVEIFIDGVKQV